MVSSGELVRDRAVGALVGVAIGDAFGSPFEGARSVDDDELSQVLGGDVHLRVTDDAVMTAGLARSLVGCGGFDGEHLARTFAADHEAEPWRGYGPGPPRIFRMLDQGHAWDEAPRRLYGGEGPFGNGGAMRVATVLGNGITAEGSVPAALAAALIADGSFAETLRFALRIGGDTDTIGAMAGALAGAREGVGAIPADWRERAELTDELARLAEQLLTLEVRR